LQSVADKYARGDEPQHVMFLEGLALAALGRHEDAAQRLSQAAERDRPTADILFHLAQTELECGRFSNAQASLQRALAADPNHAASRALWSRMEVMAARAKVVR
jgi:thioredoxin-like negative regulator of GroEL